MASNDPSAASVNAPPRRSRARGYALLWLIVLALLAFGGWKLQAWWRTHMQSTQAATAYGADEDNAGIPDPPAAIAALRNDQRKLTQRISDIDSGNQVLRDEVLGVGERAALLEQSVARIASPHTQCEQALRLDEAELLLTIGQQQLALSSDVGSALHAYALADGTLAGSSDPAVVNLRQSLAQETAAMRALPPDPRASIAGRLDAFEASLESLPLAASPSHAAHASVLDRVIGSMVEVRHTQAQDLLDPTARDAALTAVRLELTLARLALERRDAGAFDASLTRIDSWLPRLYAPETVARQRAQLAEMRRAPLRIELPSLGGTLNELRRLRQSQPDVPPPAATNAAAVSTTGSPPVSAPASTMPATTPAKRP